MKYRVINLEENLEDLSKTQQRKLNEKIINKTRLFLKEEFLDYLNEGFKKICNYEFSFKYEQEEPDSILFCYPTNSNDNYILPYIKLEIGVLAANFPVEEKSLSSIIFDYNQEVDFNDTLIPVISVIRTFWEKITIIHAECKRDPSKYHRRYSRHFYDVYKILTLVKWEELVKDKNLIIDVVRFKEKYYAQNSAKYDEVIIGKLDITLNSDAINYFTSDYEFMINMFIKDFPKFEELNDKLRSFQVYYNNL